MNTGSLGSFYTQAGKIYLRFKRATTGKRKSVFVCPAHGPDKLSKAALEIRRMEILKDAGLVPGHVSEETKQGITFAIAAGSWLHELETRDYAKPIASATSKSYGSAIVKLNGLCGSVPLAGFTAKKLGEVVQALKDEGLAPKTVRELASIAKQIVASVVDDEGEEIYPRKWPQKIVRVPLQTKQKQPAFQPPQVSALLEGLEARGHRYAVLCALIAASGLRFSEALALELGPQHPDSSTISPDCRILYINKSVFGLKKQDPKTPSAVRQVDLDPAMAAYLKEFIADRKSGWLFQSDTGKPLSQRNVLRDAIHPVLRGCKLKNSKGKVVKEIPPVIKNVEGMRLAAHGLRRFRATELRASSVPEDLTKYWLGHAEKDVTDRYSKLKERLQLRQEWAEKIGLGFNLPLPPAPAKVVAMPEEKIA
jgi:integrase